MDEEQTVFEQLILRNFKNSAALKTFKAYAIILKTKVTT